MAERSKDPYQWEPSKTPGILRGTHLTSGAVRYRVRYRPQPHSAQTSRTFATLDEAKRFKLAHDGRRQAQLDGQEVLPPRRTPPFGEYARGRFLARYSGGTAVMHDVSLKALQRSDPEFMAMPVGLIRKGDIEIALTRMEKVDVRGRAGYSPGSINRTRQTIITVLNHAADNGVIARLHLRLPKRKVAKPQRTPRTAELQLILAALPEHHRTPVLMLATTGVRISELLAMRLEDVAGLSHDLRAGWSGAGGEVRVRGTKTEGSERTVALAPGVVELVAEHLNRYGPGPQGELWSGRTRGRLGIGALRVALQRASEQVLGRPVKLHTLRRFYVTSALYAGFSVHDVMADVGHATPNMTLRVYSEVQADREQEERRAAAFGGLLLPPSVERLG